MRPDRSIGGERAMTRGGCAAFRVTRRAPVAALLALAVVLAGAAGAAAAPVAPNAALAAKARALQTKLDAQHAEVERITEELDYELEAEAQRAFAEAFREIRLLAFI